MTFTDLHEVEHVVQRVWVCIERLLVNVRRYFSPLFRKALRGRGEGGAEWEE